METRSLQRGLGALIVVVLLAAMGFVVTRDDVETAAAPVPTTTSTTVPPTTTTEPPPEPEVPVSTALASPKGEIPTFDGPDGEEVGTAGFWYGWAQTMPIVEENETGEWLRIMLPERPNGKTGWVRAADVDRSTTAHRIVIDLSDTKLTVYEDGFPQFTIPAGIGRPATPTPIGNFYVGVKSDPGLPGYGSVVLDTTGHSETIQSWQGSGDAITSIHGQISQASANRIGTEGTVISNGCVRLHFADQLKLDVVPVGAPVDVVA